MALLKCRLKIQKLSKFTSEIYFYKLTADFTNKNVLILSLVFNHYKTFLRK